MSDGRSQTVVRNVEIEERAAHKDSGGVDLLIECVLAVDQQDAQAFPGEQSSALKTGESRADDGYVRIVHKLVKALCDTKSVVKATPVIGPASSL